jgi:hypothetical protein
MGDKDAVPFDWCRRLVPESILPRLEFQHRSNPALNNSAIYALEGRRHAFGALNHQSISVADVR